MKTILFCGLLLSTFFFACSKKSCPGVALAPARFTSAFVQGKINWPGNYMNENGITLTIANAPSSGMLKFDLQQNTGKCQQSIHGSANLTKPNLATYILHDTLSVSLIYKADEVQVAEMGFSKDVACYPFSGTYHRK